MSRLAVPDRLDERAGLRHPTCVFPWCSRPARRCDKDHGVPYDERGPTCDCNLAPLCRFHHRLKTHGRWLFTRLDETTVLWRSPHGLSFLRDHTGTRDFTDTQALRPPDDWRPRPTPRSATRQRGRRREVTYPRTVPSPGECLVCDKHAAADPGLEVHRDDLVYVGHLPALPHAYLGHLFVEPLEHRPGLADLTPEQAAAVGQGMRRASVTLRAAGHDHVYAFVYGDRVPHLHVHLLGRYPGAPEEYRGTAVDEWPQAPRGDAADVAEYVERLRSLWISGE